MTSVLASPHGLCLGLNKWVESPHTWFPVPPHVPGAMSQPPPAKEETQTQKDLVLKSTRLPHNGKWEEIDNPTQSAYRKEDWTFQGEGWELDLGLEGLVGVGPGTGPNWGPFCWALSCMVFLIGRSSAEIGWGSGQVDRLIYAHLVMPEQASYGCPGLSMS